MKTIQPIGHFFAKDAAGYLLNDTAFEKIPQHWLPVLEKIKNKYLQFYGSQVHSIYLRGSLPRGVAVDGFSDVDVFALLHEVDWRWRIVDFQTEIEAELQSEFSFVRQVEAMASAYQFPFFELVSPSGGKNKRLAVVIKTQSLCIHGTDLNAQIPPCLPDRNMILHLHWLEEDVIDFLKKKEEEASPSEIRAIIKVIIRSGFELVLEKQKIFTPDLYWCAHAFGETFPEQADEMWELLYLFLNPPEEIGRLRKIVKAMNDFILSIVRLQPNYYGLV